MRLLTPCALALLLFGLLPTVGPRVSIGQASPYPAPQAVEFASTSAGDERAILMQGTRLRAGSQNVAGDIGLFVAADRGYFVQEGLDLEIVPFANASEMNAALATEQVDVAGTGGTAAMWNVVARGVRQKLVLDKGSFAPGFGFTAIVMGRALHEASGGDLAALRGRSLAMIPPGLGSANGVVLSTGLPRVGLTAADVNVVALPFADMIPALTNGAVDAAMIGEPFLTRAVRAGAAVRVIGNDELYPNFTVSALVMTPTLYANHSAAKGFAKAYVRAIRDYLNAVSSRTTEADRLQIETTMSGFTRIDQATIREMVQVGFSPNGLPNQQSLLDGYRLFRELGLIPQALSEEEIAGVFGLELVEEALQEIGRLP